MAYFLSHFLLFVHLIYYTTPNPLENHCLKITGINNFFAPETVAYASNYSISDSIIISHYKKLASPNSDGNLAMFKEALISRYLSEYLNLTFCNQDSNLTTKFAVYFKIEDTVEKLAKVEEKFNLFYSGYKSILRFMSSEIQSQKTLQKIKQAVVSHDLIFYAILVAISIIVVVLVLNHFAKLSENIDGKWILKLLVEQSLTSSQIPKNCHIRLIFSLWMFCCVTINGVYRSALVALLTKPEDAIFMKIFMNWQQNYE